MMLSAKVDTKEAMGFLGHHGRDLASIDSRLREAAKLCEKEISPRGTYETLSTPKALELLPGHSIAKHLDKCPYTVLMAVTLGQESEMALKREAALGATGGMLFDACASSCVEQAANELDALIASEARSNGLEATGRFSPGYGDLPLSCQGAFIKACGADKALGISVTDSDFLVPSKSITAVIGLRPIRRNTDLCGPEEAPFLESEEIASAVSYYNRCFNCAFKGTCDSRANGRTCYGDTA